MSTPATEIKTSADESQRIERMRHMSPMMAALANVTGRFYAIAESDRMWAELDAS